VSLRDLGAVVARHDGVRRRLRSVVGRSSCVSAGGLVDSRVCIATRNCRVVDCLICAGDIGPLPAEVGRKLIAGTWLVWSDLDRPDIRRICLIHIKVATRPVSDAFWSVGVASIPNAKMQSRGSLRILVIATSLAIVGERSNNFAVDQPVDFVFGPVVRIGMERARWVVDFLLSAAVVNTFYSFAKVVSLNETFGVLDVEVVARPLPVELVFVVAHENTTRDQTGSRGRLNFDVYTTEHKIVLRPDVWCVISLGEGEVGAHVAVVYYGGVICENKVTRQRTLLSEIDLVGLVEAGDWIGACFYELLVATSHRTRSTHAQMGCRAELWSRPRTQPGRPGIVLTSLMIVEGDEACNRKNGGQVINLKASEMVSMDKGIFASGSGCAGTKHGGQPQAHDQRTTSFREHLIVATQ